MTIWNPQANELFLKVREFRSRAERQQYLDGACSQDTMLRAEVESLLEADAQASGFLESPLGALNATLNEISATARSGEVIGPYKLREQIGEGGMGLVFVAEQQQPVRRKVALKVIKPGMDTRQVVARFEVERQALALMDHPHIAKVLDAGATDSGRPYFVMELVKGVPITDYCDRNKVPVRERLELFVHVCQAVQHAHQKGIIHRDIKPSNVLVMSHDGRPVVKVIDFGVAKAIGQQLTDKTIYTQFAQLVGTPLYMSPEQAGQSSLDVDTRSDIYSLGVLLYELLTGSTPFEKERLRKVGYDEIRRIIREEEPPRPSTRISTLGQAVPTVSANRGSEPRKLSALFRGELDWIVMKALEKERTRRYETAGALVADVQRYLHDEPVLACPPSAGYRFRKFARRNKAALAVATATAAATLVALAALAVGTFLIVREQQATEKALQGETEAKGGLSEALQRERRLSYFHRIALAHGELSRDNLGRALEQLEECPPELRQWEWHYLYRLCRVEPIVLRAKAEVNSLAYSPDGEWIVSGGGDGNVTVWNVKTSAAVQTLRAETDCVYSVAFHPGGQHVATVGMHQKVKVWDLNSRRPVFTGSSDAALHNAARGTAYGVAFSPDGRLLAAGHDRAVNVWDWEKDQLLFTTLKVHARKGINVVFSPDGRRLASGSWSGEVMIWDAVTGERLHTLSEHYHPISALAFSPDGRRLVTASFDRRLIVWDSIAGQRLRILEGHDGLVLGAAFSPDGLRLASVGEDKTVRLWEAATGREVLDLRGHTKLSQCVAFSPDGLRLASASMDGTIRVWNATPLHGDEAQEARTFREPASGVWTLAVSSDGQRLATAGLSVGGDAPVTIRDLGPGQASFELRDRQSIVFSVAWHPNGRQLASSGLDLERKLFIVKVWDALNRRVDFELPAVMETFTVAFSPDGEYLVTGREDGSVHVWDARTGAAVGRLGQHGRREQIRGLVFSPDRRRLASASNSGTVNLWDATRLREQQQPLHRFRGYVPLAAMNLAFSPDGQRLAAGGADNTVKIWNVHTGQPVQTLTGHSGDVWATAFSPDPEGRWIASAGEDSTVKVWDSRSGTLLHSFRGHTGLVSSVAFSPDGRWLYSGSRDQTVKVWDVTRLSSEVGDR